MKSSKRQILLAVLLVTIFTLLIFHGVLFRSGIVFGKDTVAQGYPINWSEYQAQKQHISQGWFPYMMCGFPMIGSEPYYVLDWVLKLDSVNRIITWRYVVHILICGLFMFTLMRRFKRSLAASLVGASSFAFSAFFISKIYAGHGGAIWSGIWIPFVLLWLDAAIATRRVKYAILMGAAIGMQVLGQHPQYVYYSSLAVLLYAGWQIVPEIVRERKLKPTLRYAGLAAIVIAFAFLISAPVILPFVQQTALSNRGGGASYDFASSLSLSPEQLITALAPSFWGNPTRQNSVFGALYWDGSMFIGVLPFIFAVIAVFGAKGSKANYFKFLALLSVFIALGDHTPFFRLVYHIPGFNMVRAPSKILYLYTFAAAALAAYGVDVLLTSAERLRMQRAREDDEPTRQASVLGRKATRVFKIAFIGSATVLAAWFLGKSFVFSLAKQAISRNYKDPSVAIAKMNGLYLLQIHTLLWLAAFTAVGLFICVAVMRKWISPRIAGAFIVVFVFMDLWMYANPLLYTIDARKTYLEGDRKAIEVIKADSDRFRILPMDDGAFHYAQGVFDGIESVNGYYPISIARYATYVGAIENKPKYVSVSADIKRPDSKLVGLLNVKYVISSTRLHYPNLVEVYPGKSHVYYNRNWMPRAFIVHQAKAVQTAEAAINIVKKPNFDAKHVAIIENDQPLLKISGNSKADNVKYISYQCDNFALQTYTKSAGYLVLSETYYPGWQAYVDGKQVDVLHADYLFRGIYLPKGKHIVRMRYVNEPAKTGGVLATCGLSLVAGMFLIGMVRRPKP